MRKNGEFNVCTFAVRYIEQEQGAVLLLGTRERKNFACQRGCAPLREHNRQYKIIYCVVCI
jgi:hypothetical protein